MNTRGKILVAIVMIALVVGLLSTAGLSAPRTVTMWSFAENNAAEWKARKAEIDKKFNISLNIQIVAENAFVQKLQATMMDKKDFPDFIEWRIENNQVLFTDPAKSFVAPLEKYTAKSKVFPNVPAGRVAFVKYGTHVYGLPHDVHPCVMLYNDTLWKSVGVDMASVVTWDDFFAAAAKLCAEKKDGKPIHFALPENGALTGTMFMVMQQAGAQLLNKEGTKPQFDTPQWQAFVQKWVDWYKTGTMCSWDWGNFGAMLKNGTMASYCSPDWWVPQINDAAAAGVVIKARPMPLYPGSKAPTASWGGTFMGIVKLAKNQDQLYRIIEYMQYDGKSATERYKTGGMLPPLASVYDDPVFHQPDSRLGGQKLGELQIAMAKQMPQINTGSIFWDAINDFNEQFTEIQSGKISVADGCKKAQEKALSRVK